MAKNTIYSLRQKKTEDKPEDFPSQELLKVIIVIIPKFQAIRFRAFIPQLMLAS